VIDEEIDLIANFFTLETWGYIPGAAAGAINEHFRQRDSGRKQGLHRRTAAEQFATILLPNSVAQHETA
jgi:hypothetical protein